MIISNKAKTILTQGDNRAIETAQVIEELIDMAKEMDADFAEAKL